MPSISQITALVVAPPAIDDATAELYLSAISEGTVLSVGLEAVLSWPVDQRFLVLGAAAEQLLDAIDAPVDVIIDPEWREGPASSLRAGFDVAARADTSDAVLVASLDRPLPSTDTVAAVIEMARSATRPVTAAKYRYEVDYPYLVHHDLWPRFLGLDGAGSMDSLAATHPEWIAEAWIDQVPPRRYRSAGDVGAQR